MSTEGQQVQQRNAKLKDQVRELTREQEALFRNTNPDKQVHTN